MSAYKVEISSRFSLGYLQYAEINTNSRRLTDVYVTILEHLSICSCYNEGSIASKHIKTLQNFVKAY